MNVKWKNVENYKYLQLLFAFKKINILFFRCSIFLESFFSTIIVPSKFQRLPFNLNKISAPFGCVISRKWERKRPNRPAKSGKNIILNDSKSDTIIKDVNWLKFITLCKLVNVLVPEKIFKFFFLLFQCSIFFVSCFFSFWLSSVWF